MKKLLRSSISAHRTCRLRSGLALLARFFFLNMFLPLEQVDFVWGVGNSAQVKQYSRGDAIITSGWIKDSRLGIEALVRGQSTNLNTIGQPAGRILGQH